MSTGFEDTDTMVSAGNVVPWHGPAVETGQPAGRHPLRGAQATAAQAWQAADLDAGRAEPIRPQLHRRLVRQLPGPPYRRADPRRMATGRCRLFGERMIAA
jgi:hypothetical protein